MSKLLKVNSKSAVIRSVSDVKLNSPRTLSAKRRGTILNGGEKRNKNSKSIKSSPSANSIKTGDEPVEPSKIWTDPDGQPNEYPPCMMGLSNDAQCSCLKIIDDEKIGGKRPGYMDRQTWLTAQRLNELRKKAQEAVKANRTFTIRGCFYSIRKGLLQRGWVEKLDIHRRESVTAMCQVVMDDLPVRKRGETRRQHLLKCERNIMSRFLEHIPIDFLWSSRKEKTDWIDMTRNPTLIINRFQKSPFTTKEGLCSILRDFHWYFEEGVSETFAPRCFNVWNPDDMEEFIDNFRMTACISILRFVGEQSEQPTEPSEMDAEEPTKKPIDLINVPFSCIEFALRQCRTYLRSCQHYDIDEVAERVWDHDWDLFLIHYQMLTQEGGQLIGQPSNLVPFQNDVKTVMSDIERFWPQFALDGVLNIWIIKPSNRCRGRGIHLMNDFKKIVSFVTKSMACRGRLVVQKYIERPLIIHNCKFDIRQWFMVTSVQPLIIWMYKDSYLRFSSQEFSLNSFHQSVHLTNFAIQKHYKTAGKRDKRLPRDNMWDCYTFQAYLHQIGKGDMWESRIYPGMQKALIGAMLASQDLMDRRPNTFELYGADFMVSDECYPWLIEINANPDLASSTRVTARLCPQCLEDLVKVIVDYRNDPKSPTGGFEMIYKQVVTPPLAYLGLNLCLTGSQIQKNPINLKKDRSREQLVKITAIQRPPKPTIPLIKDQGVAGKLSNIVPPIHDLNDRLNVKINPVMNRFPSNLTAKFKSTTILDRLGMTTEQQDVRLVTKQCNKIERSGKRHTSCCPRLMVPIIDEPDPDLNLSKKSYLTCVGSKCCLDNGSHLSPIQITGHRRRSIESDHQRPIIRDCAALKPNLMAASSHQIGSQSNRSKGTTSKKSLKTKCTVNRGVTPKEGARPSNFYAIGLSLRAWRSKYNRTNSGKIGKQAGN